MRSSSRTLLVAYAAVFFGVLLLPLLIVLVFSFSADSSLTFPPRGVSLRWFEYLAGRHELVTAALSSLQIAAIASMVSLALGTLAALALVRERFRGKAMVESVLM